MTRKALIFHGGWQGHEPKLVSKRFASLLEKEDFEVFVYDTLECLGDKDFLLSMDLIIPMWTQGELDDRYAFFLSEAVESGVGLAGAHGGMCDSFRWSVEYQFMTGSQWVAHPGDVYYHHISKLTEENLAYVQKNYPTPSDGFQTDYIVNVRRGAASPIVEGIPDFRVHSEQYYLHLDPCVNVLATTLVHTVGPHSANGPVAMPVVYTKLWGKGRVFYSSLGHVDAVFEIPEVTEIMRRGMLWAARK
ncbi:ThuA domain-containing protein [Chloroflexota bacterium]|nr:ThuA domain-containing protein [Chloroflexota bacterium]